MADESEPISKEDRAKLMEEESSGLRWCLLHELVVWWDGPGDACPVCQMENEEREQAAREFLALTKDLK